MHLQGVDWTDGKDGEKDGIRRREKWHGMNDELDVGKVNLVGKGGMEPFPTGTSDIPPGILTVIHPLFEVIAIATTHTAFTAFILIMLHQTTVNSRIATFHLQQFT